MRTDVSRRRWSDPIVAGAAVLLIALGILALIGPPLWGDAAEKTDVRDAFQASSWAQPFGTDALGRDIFLRALASSRLSLVLALAAAAFGMLIGIPLGVAPSVLGNRSRRAIAAVIGATIALPGLLLALFTTAVIGIGATAAVVGVGIANAPALARLSQTLTFGVASRDYVATSRLLGAGRVRVLGRHILPNVAEPLILTATMSVGWCLLEIAALSFLGLGVAPPDYDWGLLLKQGLESFYSNPMGALGPGAFVVAGGLAFALLGEALSGAVARVPRYIPPPGGQPARELGIGISAPKPPEEDEVLAVDGLTVSFPAADGHWVNVVDDVTLTVRRGETIGIVGESGSGKTMTVRAIANLVEPPGHVSCRVLRVRGVELTEITPSQLRTLLGTSMALVSQDPLTALNPALRVGSQVAEPARVHLGVSRGEARELAINQLDRVSIDEPRRRYHQFPYEFSGGMRQRAVIAMGLMAEPSIVLADEPTTALDVTVQQQVLELLSELNRTSAMAIVLISHDLAVVTSVCSRVVVMYAGRIVEDAAADELMIDAAHPYTRALLAAVPTMTTNLDRPLSVIPGRPPTAGAPGGGCAFAPRCAHGDDRCAEEGPPLVAFDSSRRVACWYPLALRARESADLAGRIPA